MRQRGIWLAAGVLAVGVLLAQIAGASTREETASNTTIAAVNAEQTTTAATVSLPEQASSVGRENSAKGIATANEPIAERGKTTSANEIAANAPAPAPKDGTTGASGARPGWGCGDTNHTHSGPPGRPNATPPPGCAKP
jgi:hypothetical protein